MSKKTYIGISSKARQVKTMYIGVNGKARKIKKAYIGVNGIARQFYPSMQLITTSFTSSIFPNNFADNGNRSAVAENTYGTWLAYCYDLNNNENPGLAFDAEADTRILYYLTSDLDIWVRIVLPENVSIKPTTIQFRGSYVKDIVVSGLNEATGAWEDLGTATAIQTTTTTRAISCSKDNFYTAFQVNFTRYNGTYRSAQIHDFDIKQGTIKYPVN